MAVVTVLADNTRLSTADNTTNWGNIGGGAGIGSEPDIVYQGTAAVSRKISTSRRGLEYTHSSVTDLTSGRTTWLCKVNATNYAALQVVANPGAIIYLGGSSTVNYEYQFLGGDTYPIKGGWVIEAIDPNVAAHRDATNGSPNIAQIDYFGIDAIFTATSKAENLVMDAVDIGSGLVMSGGDGANDPGTFQDFVDTDEGNSTNRWGYVTTQDGVLFTLGMLTIGSGSTEFNDSNQTVVFKDSYFAAGFSGITTDLTNSGTYVTMSSCSYIGRGTITGEDTRPVFTATASSGSLYIDSCSYTNFTNITLNSASTMVSTVVNETESLTPGGATIDLTTFNSPAVTTGTAFATTDDLSVFTDCIFNSGGGGYAIEITATGSYTFIGNQFNGYAGTNGTTGNEVIFNDTGGLVTINIGGGGDTPTYRNGSGASTVVNNNIAVTLTGMKDNTEVRVYSAGTTTELAGIENATSGTTDDRSFAFSLSAGTNTDIVVHNVDYEYIRLESFEIPASDSSLPIQQRFDRNYNNPL